MVKMLPDVDTFPQAGPMKLPGGFVWGVSFTLQATAPRAGHIFQEIRMGEGGPTKRLQTRHYMEAWPVNRGDAVTGSSLTLQRLLGSSSGDGTYHRACNDFFVRRFAAGASGYCVYRAVAAFYDEPLPQGFIASNPATGALSLPSRVIDAAHPVPTFWDGIGILRVLSFEFDFSSSTSVANATLQTVTMSPGRIRTTPAPAQWTTSS